MELQLYADERSGEVCLLRYDHHGYELIIGDEVRLSHRLEAVCYLLNATERERIALMHGLQDAREFWLTHCLARSCERRA